MGKLTEDMWNSYLEKTHDQKLSYTLKIHKETIIQLSEQLSYTDSEKAKKACEELCTILTNLEKKAFLEGIHMMLDRI